ncbi:uncharacterized protein PHACADRAFT_210406 [Phanerochaete carnosa HHB-10118-sp]|uniref:Cytochrome P450 n=1 Tax=Phanerochaete carnosa (strain HHB-10118-sp) TaxID=650164 RepID=K5UWZ6_PHACS|nr:uncharacterized protein PHACADRAFT_210406 [Phanerochaete carnosa HHB-10118-sp]EKM54606.1 hypothetical protein PHACADRAFT_210406 [Phanerochaete carnosa HHB-10118-sp]
MSLLFLALSLVIGRALWDRLNRPAPFPPGPPADLLVGNVRTFPAHDPHLGLMELAKKYGDVMYFNIFGKSVVILSSQTAASDLLEKRSMIYSSRPRFMVHEMVGWTDMLSFLPYGEQFHKQRKLFQQAFTRQGCLAFRSSQLSQTHLLLKKIMQYPARFEDHVRRFSTAVIMEITYGHKVTSDDDPYVNIAEETNRILMKAGHSLSIIDFFPSLQYLPSWLPGNWFTRFAEDAAPSIRNMRDFPFEQVRQQMASDNATPSFMAMHIEELERNGGASLEDLQILKVASSQMYAAGAETTWSTILNVIVLLLLNPEVQHKAQTELDGVPHCTTADDIYCGMYIPKGTTVLANSTALAMDDKVYSNPTEFRPERFLPPQSEPLPVNISFGWGRRMCPGRHFADASVWIVIASLLAVFEIAPRKNSMGQDNIPDVKWVSAITRLVSVGLLR